MGCYLEQGSWAYTCARIPSKVGTTATTSTLFERNLVEWHKGHSLGPLSRSLCMQYMVAQSMLSTSVAGGACIPHTRMACTEGDSPAGSLQFKHGQLVWAKHGQHPYWPARISSVINEHSFEVEFFPDETAGFAEVQTSQLVAWRLGYEQHSKARQSDPKFRRAIEAATVACTTDGATVPQYL